MKRNYLLILFFISLVLLIGYNSFDSKVTNFLINKKTIVVSRIIDGDTVVLVDGNHVRLLGINAPEKGEIGYKEAKDFLSKKVLNKSVTLVYGSKKYDLYKRELAYIFLGDENINLESVEKGYSGYYFPKGKTEYYSKFYDAWENCMKENIGICERRNEPCLRFYWAHDKDIFKITNVCIKNIDLNGYSVKDEGRKKYVFSNEILKQNESVTLTSKEFNKTYVWTNTGDSVFVRDENNKLIYFNTY